MRTFLALFLVASCVGPTTKESNPTSLDSQTTVGDADGDGISAEDGDCNDENKDVYPSAPEICDSIDNNCDGVTDEGVTTDWFPDADGDGFGDASASATVACEAPEGSVSQAGDCNDADANYHPGATENCDDPNDYNCDGSVGYVDADGDGFAACKECDDGNKDINPGAQELCNGVDDNCDTYTDGSDAVDRKPWYRDSDGDGYGDTASVIRACNAPMNYVAADGDCDDSTAAIYPTATELCNGIDDNCDGSVDGSHEITYSDWYRDADGDGYGDDSSVTNACSAPSGTVSQGGDCDDQNTDYHPGASETDCTDPNDYNCDGSVGFADADQDGYPACEECDDTNAAVSPDATEVCNGLDDNCDGSTDGNDATGQSTFYLDLDGDGYGDSLSAVTACDAPYGYVASSGDCDDSNPDFNPGAVETDCSDPSDYNCDGVVAYQDADQDGVAACKDCDDTSATVYPGAAEVCNGTDDNCDGTVDGVNEVTYFYYYEDVDGDGYGDPATAVSDCSLPFGMVEDGSDCDDGNEDIHPGATEVCDPIDADEDCSGAADDADPGVDASSYTSFYGDNDGDGYGAGNGIASCDATVGFVANSTDCNDASSAINPGSQEICDASNTDEDCDGLADNADPSAAGTSAYYQDKDGDTYGSTNSASYCDAPSGWVSNSGDCNDASSAIYPGAQEVCDASNTDEDCNGLADDNDPGASGKSSYYVDSDGDGYGSTTSTLSCDIPSGSVANNTDCNDSSKNINPGAQEVCDASNTDEDCDGLADDNDSSALSSGKGTFYKDSDGDGYGSTNSAFYCDAPSGYVSNKTDCNDSSSAINPGAQEVCDASNTDEDCDGLADDNDSSVSAATKGTYYQDADRDGYGSTNGSAYCDAPLGYVSDKTDCNDASSAINPGAVEVCDASNTDEDCDGLADDNDSSVLSSGKSTYYKDSDGDGYGSTTGASYCDAPSGYVSNKTDCNDASSAVNPGAQEVCDASNTDEDCDGLADDNDSSVLSSGKSTYYKDTDGDGYGSTTGASYCDAPSGYVTNKTDCNDSSSAINPGAQEVCDASNTDEDCDGLADDNDSSVLSSGKSTYYKDTDGDGYGSTTGASYCDAPSGYVTNKTDCNDSSSAINPGAQEICDASNTDEDCDGLADDNDSSASSATKSTYYRDADGDGYGSTTSAKYCDQPSGYVTNNTDCDDTAATAYPGHPTPGSTVFSYTGAQQSFTVPACATSVTITAYGAAGRASSTSGGALPGYGGMAKGTLSVASGDVLYVYVGSTTGYNGGGSGWSGSTQTCNGGGASDVRSGGTALTNRVIVAGGGGGVSGEINWGNGGNGGGGTCGANYCGGAGGSGYYNTSATNGGSAGGAGVTSCHGGAGGGGGYSSGGGGATSTCYGTYTASTGTLGTGGVGNGPTTYCGPYGIAGGGGGYYGGGGAAGGYCGGGGAGGGSSWTGTLTSPSFSAGAQSGNGSVTISY